MKAIVCRRYGPPETLKVEDVEQPAVPDDGVLVRVHASSANPVDLFPLTRAAHVARMLARLRRLSSPFDVLGTDFAGTVAAVGKGVTRFQPGDEVFGGERGAFAEYVCVPETGPLVHKPANVSFDQVGGVAVAAITALQALRDHGHVQPGQKVLINGASGGVGTFAVQLAVAFGAEVTAVCSARNVDTVRSLGAHTVVDYAREDFTRCAQRYDLMLDVAGSQPWSACARVLAPNATFVAVGAAAVQYASSWRGLGHLLGVRLASVGGGRKVALFIAKLNQADLLVLRDLLEAGKVTTLVDRRYELSEVPAALRYLQEGHARGKVVISVDAAPTEARG